MCYSLDAAQAAMSPDIQIDPVRGDVRSRRGVLGSQSVSEAVSSAAASGKRE